MDLEEAVAETCRVAEQLPRRDARRATVGQPGLKFGQPALDARVQVEPALRHQCQCRGGDDGFADRGQPEDRLQCHRPCAFAVGEAGGLLVDQCAVARHQNDGTDQPLVVERLLNGAVNARAEIRRRDALVQRKQRIHHGKWLDSIGDALTIEILRLKKKQATFPVCTELCVRNRGTEWTA
ncbi:protein of unknown function [Rhodovastum atsumiense]|nr:protein of unknown function [Rhodovastum atsumiense]